MRRQGERPIKGALISSNGYKQLGFSPIGAEKPWKKPWNCPTPAWEGWNDYSTTTLPPWSWAALVSAFPHFRVAPAKTMRPPTASETTLRPKSRDPPRCMCDVGADIRHMSGLQETKTWWGGRPGGGGGKPGGGGEHHNFTRPLPKPSD